MYPFVRLIWQTFKHRNDGPVAFGDVYTTHHYCLPWDLDLWVELNNGRTLTLYDMGRIPLGHASGLTAALRRRKWGLTVAGSCPRYRRRIRMMEKIEMRSRALGWDDKFIYIEQSMWKNGECANHVLIRSAVTSHKGIVPPSEVAKEMGIDPVSPQMPDWVHAWIAAEGQRPWPPMSE
ncbi:acyl-CoA thioesterase [Marivivens aquimaris]|uniref:acyl-CoA thioesterase n=1 Tax=Marivivens aquimaris TaxID=2774876 RepID=UPI00187DE4FB|nr:acyl-CoA thioesterase [Marivivens aquimaris]